MVWTPDQVGAFLDSVGADRLYPLWHLIAYRGVRRAEAVWLHLGRCRPRRAHGHDPSAGRLRLGRAEELDQ